MAIEKRGERNWKVRVYLGRTASGKQRFATRTVKGTKRDAQRVERELLAERDDGVEPVPARLTLDDYLDRWLRVAVEPKVQQRTLRDYRWLLDHYVRPELGQRRLDQVRLGEIQAVYQGMLDRGLVGRTVHVTHNVLRAALRQAVRWDLLRRNPAEGVALPKWEKRPMRSLSREDVRRFLGAVEGDRYELWFRLAITTGMRPGELQALTWEAVDLDRGRVSVLRTLERRDGAWAFKAPKTASSRRTIPIPESLGTELASYKAAQARHRLKLGPAYEDLGLVFATERGTPVPERNLIRRHFKPALEAAGLPKELRLYDLRHTCASLLMEAGTNPKVVAERLGHSDVALTLNTYSHVAPGMQEDATETLGHLLEG